MATRLYSTATANPGTLAIAAGWEDSTGLLRQLWSLASSAYAQVRNTSQAGTGVANEDAVHFQGYIGPIAAQTILGGAGNTVKGQFFAREGNGGVDAREQLVVRVCAPDFSTIRGTLLDFDTNPTLGHEFPVSTVDTSVTNRTWPLAGAHNLTQVVAQDGDYIVIEVGHRNHSTNTSGVRVVTGEATATTDLPEDETQTGNLTGGSTYRGWIEFSQDIKFLIQGTTDTGAGSEGTTTETASLPRTDAGSGADASGDKDSYTTDSGSGADASANRTSYTTDSGSGADASANRTTATTESGSGADSSTETATYATTDSGAGADSSAETFIYPATDSGAGADASANRTSYTTDSGTGVDALGDRTMAATETATGDDPSVETATYATTDSGAGDDTSVGGIVIASTDAGAGVDASGDRTTVTTDAGSGVDASANRTSYTEDVGTGADSLGSRTTAALETGTGTEALGDRTMAAAESGVATEVISDRVTFTLDAGVGVDVIVAFTIEAYVDGGLMSGGAGGRQWQADEPFTFGAIVAEVVEPFDVIHASVVVEVNEVFTLVGKMGASYSEPFVLVGPAGAEVVELFHLLSPSDNLFDEGGLASPIVGWYDPDETS